MIRTCTLPAGRLEISIDVTDRISEQALHAIAGSLERSTYASHHDVAAHIHRQLGRTAALVRFELNGSAVSRVRRSLDYVYRARGAFPNQGWRELDRVLGRTRARA